MSIPRRRLLNGGGINDIDEAKRAGSETGQIKDLEIEEPRFGEEGDCYRCNIGRGKEDYTSNESAGLADCDGRRGRGR